MVGLTTLSQGKGLGQRLVVVVVVAVVVVAVMLAGLKAGGFCRNINLCRKISKYVVCRGTIGVWKRASR